MALNIFKKMFGKKEEKKESSKLEDLKEQKQSVPADKKKDSIETQIDEELKSLPPSMLRQAKNPKVKEQIKALAKKMSADGVNLKNPIQIKRWIKNNPDAVKNNQSKTETYKREEPKIGRNDLCSCGSGKKYKKCCGRI